MDPSLRCQVAVIMIDQAYLWNLTVIVQAYFWNFTVINQGFLRNFVLFLLDCFYILTRKEKAVLLFVQCVNDLFALFVVCQGKFVWTTIPRFTADCKIPKPSRLCRGETRQRMHAKSFSFLWFYSFASPKVYATIPVFCWFVLNSPSSPGIRFPGTGAPGIRFPGVLQESPKLDIVSLQSGQKNWLKVSYDLVSKKKILNEDKRLQHNFATGKLKNFWKKESGSFSKKGERLSAGLFGWATDVEPYARTHANTTPLCAGIVFLHDFISRKDGQRKKGTV